MTTLNGSRVTDSRWKGSRVRPLRETLEIAWDIRELVGISRVADITSLDRIGLPVFNAVRPNAHPGNLTVSSGKGLDREAALVSALMEATERHYGEPRGRGHTQLTHEQAEQQLGAALHPTRLVLDARTSWPSERTTGWMDATEIRTGLHIAVPAEAAFTPYLPAGTRCFAGHSDGLASGNTSREAALHGIMELVERDGQTFGELLHCGFKVAPGTYPARVRSLCATFHAAGLAVDLYYFETPVGLPVIYAAAVDHQARSSMLISAGLGCALDASEAALRAVTELAQSRLSVIAGSREDFSFLFGPRRDQSFIDGERRYREWADTWEQRNWDEIPSFTQMDLDSDLALCLDLLQQAGLNDIVVAELSPDWLPLAVVRVIVPGIEFAATERYRIGRRLLTAAKEKHLV